MNPVVKSLQRCIYSIENPELPGDDLFRLKMPDGGIVFLGDNNSWIRSNAWLDMEDCE